jgi:D-galactose 1-dehydrogenase
VFVTRAELGFPANREAPIVVDMEMTDVTGLRIKAEFDFREKAQYVWDIRIETDRGPLILSGGGAKMSDSGKGVIDAMKAEYPALYRRFVDLASKGQCDVDLAPLQIVADAFLKAKRHTVETFEF